ncbi:uncharacterized protein [Typha angustifolia]|uniref:uncharacterized protein n=1 Tax=Typha angustifolia TaxID=59011 RepID=UPI003C2DF169
MDMGPCPKVHSLQLGKEYPLILYKLLDKLDEDSVQIGTSDMSDDTWVTNNEYLEGKTDSKIWTLDEVEELGNKRSDKQVRREWLMRLRKLWKKQKPSRRSTP